MLVGKKPGESFSFTFEGDAFGVFAAAGPGTGAVDFRIDGGEWKTRALWTKWSAGLHIPQAFVLADQLPEARHTVDIRVSETRPDHPKAGTQVRLRWVLVNGALVSAP